MRVNTIPLLNSYNKTPCNRFWDGYFNYSDREWIILQSKGTEIQAVEIRNPHVRSMNALKILLLFTGIVPLIAAIHHIVKICRLKKCHVTLITPQTKEPFLPQVAQIKEIREEQATIVRPKEITPLSFQEANEYVSKNELLINKDLLIVLKNLEKIPYKTLKRFDLEFLKHAFKNLSEVEMNEEITSENLTALLTIKEKIKIIFKKNLFKQEHLIVDRADDILSLIKDSPTALLDLLLSLDADEDQFTALIEKIYPLLLTTDALSKFSPSDLDDLLTVYGNFLSQKLSVVKNLNLPYLTKYLPKVDIYPFIFNSSGDCKALLKALDYINSKDVYQKTQDYISKYPDKVKEVVLKLKAIKKNDAFKYALITYITSEKVFDEPDEALKVITQNRFHIESINNELFFSNLKTLFFHKDVSIETRRNFIFTYYEVSEKIAEYILEWLKNPDHFEQFHKTPENEFATGYWVSKTLKPYILINACLMKANKPLDDTTLALLRLKPKEIESGLFNHHLTRHFMAIDLIVKLSQGNDEPEDLIFTERLPTLIPKELIKKYIQIAIKKPKDSYFLNPFITSLLKVREKDAIQEMFDELIPRFNRYVMDNMNGLFDLLFSIDSPEKLECALDCIIKLPERKREALQCIFSAGLVTPGDDGRNKLSMINLTSDVIRESFRKKDLFPKALGIPFSRFFDAIN